MKQIKKFGIIALFAVVALGLFSCKDEDNSNSDDKQIVYQALSDVRSISTSEKAIFSWFKLTQNWYGVRIIISPEVASWDSTKIYKNETTAFVENLVGETEYTFTFITVDKDSKDTDKKTELKITTPKSDGATKDTTPPANVTNFSVEKIDGKFVLTWTDATDSDIFGYEITYSELTETAARTIAPMESGSIFIAKGTERCEMSPLNTVKPFNFTVKTMDISGNKSSGVSVKTTVLTKEECKLWTQVLYNNVEYDVVKNSFIQTTATEPTEEQKAKLSPRYDRGDAVRDAKLKEYFDIEDCIILFDKNETVSSSLTTRYDVYIILNENAEKIVRFRFLYEYSQMPSESMIDLADFYNLSKKELRQKYDPNRLDLLSQPAFYGTDYSKMKQYNFRYDRNKDGTINFESINKTYKYENAMEKANGVAPWFPTSITIEPKSDGRIIEARQLYDVVKNSNFSEIFFYENDKYSSVRAKGNGKLNESASEKIYKCELSFRDETSSKICFRLNFKKTVSGIERSQTYDVNYNYTKKTLVVEKQNNSEIKTTLTDCTTWDDFNALTTDDFIYEGISFKDTIVLSEDTNDDGMPKSITLTAPFRDRNAIYQQYTKIVLNLSDTETYKETGIPLYIPDVDGYLNKYRTDYAKLYQDYKAANP